MPQLMPLNWIFSTMVMMLILMSANFIYSENIMNISSNMNNNMHKMKNMWYW